MNINKKSLVILLLLCSTVQLVGMRRKREDEDSNKKPIENLTREFKKVKISPEDEQQIQDLWQETGVVAIEVDGEADPDEIMEKREITTTEDDTLSSNSNDGLSDDGDDLDNSEVCEACGRVHSTETVDMLVLVANGTGQLCSDFGLVHSYFRSFKRKCC